jgi:hypothetical protein
MMASVISLAERAASCLVDPVKTLLHFAHRIDLDSQSIPFFGCVQGGVGVFLRASPAHE